MLLVKSAWIWTIRRNLILHFSIGSKAAPDNVNEIAHVPKSLESLSKPGKQQTWRLILRWRKVFSVRAQFPPSPSPFNACHAGYSDDQTLQPTIEMTPGFKTFTLCILLIQICKGVPGPPIPRVLVIVFFYFILFFFQSDRPISGDAFDVKRKKGGGDGLSRNNQL